VISRQLLAATLLSFGGLALAQEDAFSQAEASAKRNLTTSEGAAYDRALGETFQSSADFEPRMNKCLAAHPGQQAVHGYFHFTSATEYQVELRPRGSFSECVSGALEGFRLPRPPTVPYFNHFTFTVVPDDGAN
jgi:hypothetical protein